MKYLGLDVGSKTIGIATGQGIISFAKETLRFIENNFSQAINLLMKLLEKEQPDVIVVGHPLNMDGSKSKTTIMIEEFVTMLKLKSNRTIIFWDERLTSKSAEQIMIMADVSRQKRRFYQDKLAAQLMLQNYFDYLKNQQKTKIKL